MCTALCLATERNAPYGLIEALLSLGADVNGTGESEGPCHNGCPEECYQHQWDPATIHRPVLFAVWNDRTDLVELFINYGVNLDVRDGNGLYPVEIACARGNVNIVKKLLPYSDKIDCGTFFTSLKFPDILSLFVREASADVCEYYDQSLYFASRDGYTESVQILLDAGAKTEYRGLFGRTALSVAIEGKHDQIVEILIKTGADVNARDHFGCNILWVAMLKYEKMVSVLLKAGATVTNDEYTVGAAIKRNNKEILDILDASHARNKYL